MYTHPSAWLLWSVWGTVPPFAQEHILNGRGKATSLRPPKTWTLSFGSVGQFESCLFMFWTGSHAALAGP